METAKMDSPVKLSHLENKKPVSRTGTQRQTTQTREIRIPTIRTQTTPTIRTQITPTIRTQITPTIRTQITPTIRTIRTIPHVLGLALEQQIVRLVVRALPVSRVNVLLLGTQGIRLRWVVSVMLQRHVRLVCFASKHQARVLVFRPVPLMLRFARRIQMAERNVSEFPQITKEAQPNCAWGEQSLGRGAFMALVNLRARQSKHHLTTVVSRAVSARSLPL